MPFDGAGNFTRVQNFTQDRDNGIKILASRMDAEFDNFSTGMNVVFFRNGIVPMSGNLALGLNSITGVADGSAVTPAIRFGSDSGSGFYLDGAGRPAITAGATKRLVATAAGVEITGTLLLSSNATFSGTLAVTGATTLSSTLAVTGAITTGGNTVATLASPTFTGLPTAPTAAVDTNSLQLANTAFVIGQGYAKLAGPTFTGVPAAPTAAVDTSTTQIATTAYVVGQGYSKLASPTFTGVPAGPTAAVDTSTTQLATTAYVVGQGYSKLAGPTFTGVPSAPTAAVSTSTTQIATTAFVIGQANGVAGTIAMNGAQAAGTSALYARADHIHPSDTSRAALAGPTFTGIPAAPTAGVDTNTTQIATTAYVIGQGYAKLAGPALTGVPTSPTAAVGTSTTQIATTAFVQGEKNPAIQTVASAATVTPTFTNDAVTITAQAAALIVANWSGTAADFWGLVVRIKDNGTARAITYGTNYLAVDGVVLPATTVVGKTHELCFEHNNVTGKHMLISALTY